MRKLTKNQFSDGMFLGVHPSGQRPTTTRKTMNFRVITRDNNSFILSKIKGTKSKGQITPNYVPLAIDDVNGVAYIISAEYIDGAFTGKGEIGSYPSPDYDQTSGFLVDAYQPLHNFGGDDSSYPDLNGPFRSSGFGFTGNNPADITLQKDYDGTVNIIFTDGEHPIRMINSGFVAKPGNRFEIINRTGSKDSNRYTLENFDNTIQLEAKSTILMKVEFLASEPGGNLPAGNIQYLFAYRTQDGNETEIIGESFNVSVFNGTRVFELDGGINTGDLTNKLNRFRLSHLDQSYSSIAVYYVLSNGMQSEIRTTYRLNQVYPISNDEMEFVHTGFEESIRISNSEIVASSSTIATAGTLDQADGHLVAGNVKEKVFDVNKVRNWFRMIKTGHRLGSLDLMGPEAGFSRLYNEPLNQTDLKAGTIGWNGGYGNPKNIHDRVGFWGGEAYPFAGRLFLKDGSATPLFPVIGVDNVGNNRASDIAALSLEDANALDETNGFSTDGKMLNNKGIYRFPNRTAGSQNDIFFMDGGEGRVSVNGVTFQIPALDVDLGDGVTIKDLAIGIQFFRGVRRADVIMQGTMMDAEIVPNVDWDHANTSEKLWNYGSSSGSVSGYTESNSKLIPTFGHYLESSDVWGPDDSGGTDKRSNSDRKRVGAQLTWMNELNRNVRSILAGSSNYRAPFAMVSTDLIVNPAAFYGIGGRSTQTKLLNRITHQAVSRAAGPVNGSQDVLAADGLATGFNVFEPQDLLNISGASLYNSKAAFAPDSLDAKNSIGFSTVARFQGRRNNSEWWFLWRQKFNAYMGLRLDTTLRASDPNPNNDESADLVDNIYGSSHTKSFLVNLYDGAGQRSATAVSQVYNNVDNIQYFPISGRLYLDDTVEGADPTNTLESQLDGERKIVLYGGDCFITHTFRKLWQNAEFSDAEFTNKNEVVRTGFTMGIINEGNYNATIRSQETRDVSEGVRRHPSMYATPNSPVGTPRGKGNQWRDYTLFESAGYNKGYSVTAGNLLFFTLPLNVPYIQSIWPTRVWATTKHVPNSFQNGYRRFLPGNYRDYPSEYGPITKLITNNNRLFCIHETAIGTIIMNEKIETANASGGQVYISSGSILSDLQVGSTEIGSRHLSSIVSTDNAVYGVMTDRGIIWVAQVGSPIAKVSELSLGDLLDDAYANRTPVEIMEMSQNVVASWNRGYDEVNFTFYFDGEAIDEDRTFTVTYTEKAKKFFSFMSFIASRYFSIGKNLFSFNLRSQQHRFWQHDSDDVDFANIYGEQNDAMVSVAVNSEPGTNKVFQNVIIDSNNNIPDRIRYLVEGALAEQEVVFIKNDIAHSNAKFRANRWEITIPNITDVHHQDIEQKIPMEKAGMRSTADVGSRVKGKFAIIELYYDDGNASEIGSINTVYKSVP